MPILSRKSLLTFKKESVYSTAPSGDYTAVLIRRDPDVAPLVVDRLARETVRPYYGADRKRLINRRVTVSLEIELSGSGAAGTAPAFGDMLLACSFNEAVVASTSVTYTLVSNSTDSVTLRWHQDGIRHQVAGARGTASIMANAGEYPMLQLTFTGIYSQPTDVALPSATFSNQADPVEVSATNTPTVSVNSVSNCMSEFELNVGNEVVFEDYAGCTTKVRITGRDPEGRIQVEDKLIAGQNFYSLATATSLVPITWTHSGGGAGNTIALTMSNCDIYEPTYADRNGVRFINLPFAPISTDGTSELTLVFT